MKVGEGNFFKRIDSVVLDAKKDIQKTKLQEVKKDGRDNS